ncbi:MAG: hypothetical protein AAF628_17075 [Planctomycetota bacterium]
MALLAGGPTRARVRVTVPGAAERRGAPLAVRPVRGRVVDAVGDPVADAQVALERHAGEEWLVAAAPVASSVDGVFVLVPTLPLGGADDAPSPRARLRVAHPEFFETALPIGATADDEVLVLVRRPIVRGHLLAPGGGPATAPGRVEVGVRLASGALREAAVEVGAGVGAFEIAGLPEGRVERLWGRARGYRPVELHPALVLRAEQAAECDLELRRGAVVEGRVLDAVTGLPLPGAEVWCESYQYEPQSLTPTAIADAEGRFRLEGVDPARIVQDVGERRDVALALVRLRAQTPQHAPTRLSASSAVWNDDEHYEFTLRLQRAASAVTGVVLGLHGQPVPGLLVHVIDSKSNVHLTTTNRHGVFDLEGLTVGATTMLARPREFDAPGGGTIAGLATELRSGPNRVELRTQTASGSIEGTYRDARGPVAGESIELRLELSARGQRVGIDSRVAATDALGRFRFDELPAAAFEVTPVMRTSGAERATAPPWHRLELVAAQRVTGVDFTVGPALVVEGRVQLGKVPREAVSLVLVDPRTGLEVTRTRPAADGGFELPPVLTGHYDLALRRGQQIVATRAVSPGNRVVDLRLDDS